MSTTSTFPWKYTISELFDAFADIVTNGTTTTTPINQVILEDDYFPIKNNENEGNKDDNHETAPPQQPHNIYAVATIDYTEAFRIAYGYFRCVTQPPHTEMASVRTLLLTGTCLQLNPANYTVWHTRRQCLSQLYPLPRSTHTNDSTTGTTTPTAPTNTTPRVTINSTTTSIAEYISMIRNELEMASILGGNNPKNYQIWYHRRAVLEHLPPNLFLQCITDPTVTTTTTKMEHDRDAEHTNPTTFLELEYIHTVLLVDAKNYHAWSHRQWIISKMIDAHRGLLWNTIDSLTYDATTNTTMNRIYDHEMTYCDTFINMDIRNNSAWNHRWYILHHRYGCNSTSTTTSTATANTTSTFTTTMDTCDTDANTTTTTMTTTTTTLPWHILESEMDITLQIITMDPYNESPYKFLIALVRELCEPYSRTDTTTTTSKDIHEYNINTDPEIQNDEGFTTTPPTQQHMKATKLIQNVIEQLHNIEQNHLLSISVQQQRPDIANTMEGLETSTITRTVVDRMPSVYLCSTLLEIYSCRVPMNDAAASSQKPTRDEIILIDELLSQLQQQDSIRSQYWQSRRKPAF